VITTSVIRSAHRGESHGGVYVVDLEDGSHFQVLDWNEDSIDWEGRGGDRGLRGIAFYKGRIYLAASDEIFVYNQDFYPIRSYRNRYLKQCHEIFICDDTLYITSTKFDAVVLFDLRSESFVKGYCLRYGKLADAMVRVGRKYASSFGGSLLRAALPTLTVFDPDSDTGPVLADTTHINNVTYADDTIYVSGVRLGALLGIRQDRLFVYARTPHRTHNAQPFRDGVLLNHTASNQIAYLNRRGRVLQSFAIKLYDEEELLRSDLPQDHARQGFARGLCLTDDLIIGGASPATISVYRFGQSAAIKTVNISKDVRNAIHGLEIWTL
jgi:hypothetical protein